MSLEDHIESARRLAYSVNSAIEHGEFDYAAWLLQSRWDRVSLVEALGSRLDEIVYKSGQISWKLDFEPIEGSHPPTYQVVVPFWTADGPASFGLHLQLREKESYGVFDFEFELLGVVDLEPDAIPEYYWLPVPERRGRNEDWFGAPTEPEFRIPEEWHEVVAAVANLVVAGDYGRIVKDGYLEQEDGVTIESMRQERDAYPDELVAVGPRVWDYSSWEEAPLFGADTWLFGLFLWTADGRRSDLLVEGLLRASQGTSQVTVRSVRGS